MGCKVCEHANRAQIESALLNMSSDNKAITVATIAAQYELKVEEVKAHALWHAPMVMEYQGEEAEPQDSITRKLKIREADMLRAVAEEYMVTLKSVGRKINTVMSPSADGDIDGLLAIKLLTRPIVDLYVGVGGEIRATIKTLAELNQLLNGPDPNGSSGLQALALALNASITRGSQGD